MKKKLIFFMAVLSLSTGFCACSSDEEPAEAPIPQGVNNRLKVLNGTFHSETFSESTNTVQTAQTGLRGFDGQRHGVGRGGLQEIL